MDLGCWIEHLPDGIDSMYEIRPADAIYVDQMVPLLLETGYYEYGAARNKLNLSTHDFVIASKLIPSLAHSRILVETSGNKEDLFVGFFIAYKQNEIKRTSWDDMASLRDDDTLKKGLLRLDDFYHEGNASEYLIADTVAIHPSYRGKGLYRSILNYQREMAKTARCSKMKICTWQSNLAREIFEHCGVQYIDEIEFASDTIKDKLLKGILNF
jgi:GNAT superfamily N-acetyltransferase